MIDAHDATDRSATEFPTAVTNNGHEHDYKCTELKKQIWQ